MDSGALLFRQVPLQGFFKRFASSRVPAQVLEDDPHEPKGIAFLRFQASTFFRMAHRQRQSPLIEVNRRQAALRFEMIGAPGYHITKQSFRLKRSLQRQERQPINGRRFDKQIALILDLVELSRGPLELMFTQKCFSAQEAGVVGIAVGFQALAKRSARSGRPRRKASCPWRSRYPGRVV